MKSFMTEKRNTLNIGIVSGEIQKLYHEKEESYKIMVVSEVRKLIFEDMFPFPNIFKTIAWIIIILWSIGACITALVYGLSFDLTFDDNPPINSNNENIRSGLYEEECWNNSMALRRESALSTELFESSKLELSEWNAGSYGGSDSKSWLLSIFQSLLLSLILWQPLTVYIITWIKIWAFTWHLKMKIGPGNLILLCKRCCCGYNGGDVSEDNDDRDDNDEVMLEQYISTRTGSVRRKTSSKVHQVLAHKNRPVDMISFLGNQDWIIDDTLNNDIKNGNNLLLDDLDEKEENKHEEIEMHTIQNKDEMPHRSSLSSINGYNFEQLQFKHRDLQSKYAEYHH